MIVFGKTPPLMLKAKDRVVTGITGSRCRDSKTPLSTSSF